MLGLIREIKGGSLLEGRLGALRAVEDAPVLLELMRQARFTVSLRLHGSVLSAAAGTPFVALGYRLKTFDFVDSIGMSRYALRTDALLESPERLNERFRHLMAEEASIGRQLTDSVEACFKAYDAEFTRFAAFLATQETREEAFI